MKKERIKRLHDLLETGGIKKGHVVEMLNEIEHLREWIKREADANDTCTFNVLGEVCDGCQCGKLATNASCKPA
jgi:hypothetical protein